jgi:transposase
MTEIGHDESQRLDMIPVQYRVIVTRRPKFACRACKDVVVQEPAPPRLPLATQAPPPTWRATPDLR